MMMKKEKMNRTSFHVYQPVFPIPFHEHEAGIPNTPLWEEKKSLDDEIIMTMRKVVNGEKVEQEKEENKIRMIMRLI